MYSMNNCTLWNVLQLTVLLVIYSMYLGAVDSSMTPGETYTLGIQTMGITQHNHRYNKQTNIQTNKHPNKHTNKQTNKNHICILREGVQGRHKPSTSTSEPPDFQNDIRTPHINIVWCYWRPFITPPQRPQ